MTNFDVNIPPPLQKDLILVILYKQYYVCAGYYDFIVLLWISTFFYGIVKCSLNCIL